MTFTVYLLHRLAGPPTGPMHYLGITASGRLSARLDEHARGRGAGLTRYWGDRDWPAALALTIEVAGPHEERRLKGLGHFRRRCPICSDCRNDLSRTMIIVTPRRAAPLPLTPTGGWYAL